MTLPAVSGQMPPVDIPVRSSVSVLNANSDFLFLIKLPLKPTREEMLLSQESERDGRMVTG